jgi:hypothetical protein
MDFLLTARGLQGYSIPLSKIKVRLWIVPLESYLMYGVGFSVILQYPVSLKTGNSKSGSFGHSNGIVARKTTHA